MNCLHLLLAYKCGALIDALQRRAGRKVQKASPVVNVQEAATASLDTFTARA